jgi:hypothetical protein
MVGVQLFLVRLRFRLAIRTLTEHMTMGCFTKHEFDAIEEAFLHSSEETQVSQLRKDPKLWKSPKTAVLD